MGIGNIAINLQWVQIAVHCHFNLVQCGTTLPGYVERGAYDGAERRLDYDIAPRYNLETRGYG